MALVLGLAAVALSLCLAKVTFAEFRRCGLRDPADKERGRARGLVNGVLDFPLPFAALVLPGAFLLTSAAFFSNLLQEPGRGRKHCHDVSDEEETGWMQLYGDVFRPPPLGGGLGLAVGAGCSIAFSELFRGLIGHHFLADCFAVAAASFLLGRLHGALGTSRLAVFLATVILVVLQIMVSLHEQRSLQMELRLTWFAALHVFAFAAALVGCQFNTLRPTGFFTGFKKIPRGIPQDPGGWLILPGAAALLFCLGSLNPLWPSQRLPSIDAALAVVCAEASLLMNCRWLIQEDYRWWWASYYCGTLLSLSFDMFQPWGRCSVKDQHDPVCGSVLVCTIQRALISGSMSFLISLRMMLHMYSKLVCDDI